MTADSSRFISACSLLPPTGTLPQLPNYPPRYPFHATADPGSEISDGICFVVDCDWSTPTRRLTNSRQTSVRRSHSKILSSLPPPLGILEAVFTQELSAGDYDLKLKNGENATIGCSCCDAGFLLGACKSLLPRGVPGRWWVEPGVTVWGLCSSTLWSPRSSFSCTF